MRHCLIYALHHERSNRIYIGKSSFGVERPKQHGQPAYMRRHAHYPVVRWIKKLRQQGNDYRITILEEVASVKELEESERFFIAYFRSIGALLLNVGDGGEGAPGRVLAPETKRRIAETNRITNGTPEARERSAIPNRGRRLSESSREKIAASLRGVPIAPEHRSVLLAGQRKEIEKRKQQTQKKLFDLIGDCRFIDWRRAHSLTFRQAAKVFGLGSSTLKRVEDREIRSNETRAEFTRATHVRSLESRMKQRKAPRVRINLMIKDTQCS